MYAIFKSGSKQYRVKKGDVIQVELIENVAGTVEFPEVLFIQDEAGGRKRNWMAVVFSTEDAPNYPALQFFLERLHATLPRSAWSRVAIEQDVCLQRHGSLTGSGDPQYQRVDIKVYGLLRFVHTQLR